MKKSKSHKAKKVKYRVTDDMCDGHDAGDIIDAYLIFEDSILGLIYLPPSYKGQCSCLILSKKEGAKYWEQYDGNTYLNLEEKGRKFIEQVI